MLARIFFGGAFIVVGAIFLFIGGSSLLQEQRYQRQSVQAPAVVTGKALRAATSDAGTSYEIAYRASPAGRAPFEQTEKVTVHRWEGVEPGSPLVVEFIPGEPRSARVVLEGLDKSADAIAVIAGSVLALIGLFVILAGGRWLSPSGDGASLPLGVPVPAGTGGQQRSFWPLARAQFGFWFGGIALLIGLPWFVVNGALPVYADWRFAREGLAAQGMVLTKEIRRSGNTRSETLHYDVTYRFAEAGQTIEGRDELVLEDWERLTERRPAAVLYRAGHPSSNRLAGDRPWIKKAFFGLLGLVFAVVGGTMFVRAVRDARLQWHSR